MSWYADELITLATPAALRAVQNDPLLSPFAYHLKNPLEHEWPSPEETHTLPNEGLLVIRPVFNPQAPESPGDWYGQPILDSTLFPQRSEPGVLVDRAKAAKEFSMDPDAMPPAGMLSYLKHLALTTGQAWTFYSCSMFLEGVEWEYAWIFDDSELVIASMKLESYGAGDREMIVLEPGKRMRIDPGDVLRTALGRLSLELPTHYFAPHTRAFSWDKYKLTGAR